ncbi:MAG: prepilin-type N-terminal cleavage/methylation domain-containing protein [Polyangiaceae bacterium]|nr:prepilin-type N-terminal cleavage/methylation domain-containing protein [Polyangiaceae bacterium]
MLHASRSRSSERGITLVELLIVISIIALLTGSVMFGSGMLGGSRLRGAAMLVLSASRLAQSRASTIGRPVRLVLDLDHSRIDMQEAVSRQVTRIRGPEDFPDEQLGSELEGAAQKEAERVTKGDEGKAPVSRFTPSPQFASDLGDEQKGSGKLLGKGIVFRQVQVARDPDPRTRGKVAIYFWPGGETERASIQLKQEHSDAGITVHLSALTGRAKLEPGFQDLPEAPQDEPFSERPDE